MGKYVKKKKGGFGWLGKIVLALLVLAVAAAGTAAYVWNQNEFHLYVTLQGEQEITVEYGDTFEDPGASAVFFGTKLMKEAEDLSVQVSGQVDVTKLGTYELVYTAQRSVDYLLDVDEYIGTQKRIVHVVDTKAPVVELTVKEGAFTFPGQEYEEEGYTASDNYDGDITDHVERTVTEEKVYYKVSDSSGNVGEAVREIIYDDPVAPELKLLGKTSITITEGDTFKEPGYEATDNCDGDLKAAVQVTGSVDTKKPGTYTLKYEVKDSYGNTVTAERKVVVKEKPVVTTPVKPAPGADPTDPTTAPKGGVIYLTFDDGPGKHTSRLLDILKKYNVKATFFVVKTGYTNLLTRMANEGHTVAIHTYTHDFSKVYASKDAYYNDLYKMQNVIYEKTGKTSMLVRFPGGSSNTVSKKYCKGIMTELTKDLEKKGFKYFDWNVDSNDAGGAKTASEVYKNVVNGVAKRKTSVVLMHDIKGYTVDAIEDIIKWGLNNGYTFLPMTASSPGCHHGVNN